MLKPKLNRAKTYTYCNSMKDYKTEEMIAREKELRDEIAQKFKDLCW